MNYQINQFIPDGTIIPPSSKSYTHRVLICSFIFNRPTTIHNVMFSDDIKATLNALTAMGGIFETGKGEIRFIKREVKNDQIIIDVKESATTLRLLLPLATYMYSHVKFSGSKSLFKRPLDVYEEILTNNKIFFKKSEDFIEIFDKFPINSYEIDGTKSSQFASGIALLNEFLGNCNSLKIKGELVSENYYRMTLDVIEQFKLGNSNFNIEPDFSLLNNFFVLGALNGSVEINTSIRSTIQEDYKILNLLSAIGADVQFLNGKIKINHREKLSPFCINISNIIDSGPILFVLASLIDGVSTITGYKNLQIKESNRLEVMINELKKVGVNIIENNDTLYISKNLKYEGKDVVFDSNNDHRVCMALIIFSMCFNGNVSINNVDCLSKSYPNFIKDLEGLRK